MSVKNKNSHLNLSKLNNRYEHNDIIFDKLVCIICNQKLSSSKLKHHCNSREDTNLSLHVISTDTTIIKK